MDAIRTIYEKLPPGMRSKIRSLAPGEVRRWAAHRRTDVYLISYPKCGRTWLRLMLGRVIVWHFSLPENEDALFMRWSRRPHAHVPLVTVVHEDRPMLKAPQELQTSKRKFRNKKVIFLARDPRDVIVSSYFEMNKRGNLFGENPYEDRKPVFDGSLVDFIDRREGGFDTIICYYNIWAQNRDVPEGFLLVRYEDMKENTFRELRRAVNFLGLSEIDDELLKQAVEYASFKNMRKMEAAGAFTSGMLTPGNRSDQESYKTRRGKIGGHQDYLSSEESARLLDKIRTELSDFYGYG
jgi:hypothetical protein